MDDYYDDEAYLRYCGYDDDYSDDEPADCPPIHDPISYPDFDDGDYPEDEEAYDE